MKINKAIMSMDARKQKRILWGIAALLAMAVIFAFSSQASGNSENLSDALTGLLKVERAEEDVRLSSQSVFFGLTLKRIAHLFMFAALGFCVYQLLADCKRRFALTVGLCCLYAVLDEVHQGLCGQSGRWQDALIDLLAIVAGVGMAMLLPWLNRLCKKHFHEDWDAGHPAAKRRLERWLDALSLAAVMQYVAYRFLQTTMFPFIYSELYKTATFLSLVIFGGVRFAYLFARKLWSEKDEKAQLGRFLRFIGVCCLALPFFIVAFLHDYKVLMFIPICWMCLYDMRAELVFKWYVRVVGIMLAATVLCCLAGVVRNLSAVDQGIYQGAYGMINTTDFAAYILFLLLFSWCVRAGNKRWRNLPFFLVVIGMSIGIYYLTRSRTTLISCILLLFAIIWEQFVGDTHLRKGKAKWLSKPVEAAATIAAPAILILLIAFTALYGSGSDLGIRLDSMLSNRLHDTYAIFQKYGLRLFGAMFTMHGNGGSILHDYRNYDFLDSSYSYMAIRYGMLLTLIIMLLWIRLTILANRSGKKQIMLSMAIISVFSFTESHFVDLNYNLLLVMPFCAISGMAGETDSDRNTDIIKEIKGRWPVWVGIVALTGTVCVLLPRIMSWLRTFFYILRWNSGMQTMKAFLMCVCISLVFYMVVKLCAKWGQQHKKRLPFVLLGFLLICGLGTVGVNSVIQKGIAEYRQEMNEEESVIRRVLETAEQPVYAAERSEVYQRVYGGFAEHVMTAEELCRAEQGTMITDKSHELMLVMIHAGTYIQFSQDSGIYTYDPEVIAAMEAMGYPCERFYYSERVCDLADLAQLNHLKRDERGGLILNGPEHSLSVNRFVDQRGGNYEVRYVLRLDTDAAQANMTEPVCSLRVMGFKGEETIAEREVFSNEFDDLGQCTIIVPYTIGIIPRTEYRVYAEDGVTLFVDEIAWRRAA